jgi:7-cyano-7-deazaguanine synthase
MHRMVAIVSGGMDSVTLAHLLASESQALHLLSVNYGQRHRKELLFAEKCAARLSAEWKCIDLTGLTHLLQGSALTDPSVPVPHGHYAAESMRSTVVPNRNAILFSIAAGWAVSLGADGVASGVHAGDHAIYPDCRPEFVTALSKALVLATEGFAPPGFRLYAPFVGMTKAEIASLGKRLGVPWEQTWSCYEGGAIHCGRCGTCVERREAFQLAGVGDRTEYAG